MAVTVVEQLVATIKTGTTFTWTMSGVNPPFNKNLSKGARPKWVVEWQAIPILEEIGADVLDHPDPRIQNSRAGLRVAEPVVVREHDTSLTHIVSITCTDAGNPPPGMPFTVTYVLYAIFTDVK
jgi:hypothetical protein